LNIKAIKIKKLSTGIFNAVDLNKTGNSAEIKTEVFPVINMERAKQLKNLFTEAVKQCK
jgi:hypothetical protein